MDRQILLTILAEAATGAEVIDEADIPDPDAPVPLEILADPYLVEPADPDVDPKAIEWDTTLRPSEAGRDLLFVGDTLERWLGECPGGPLALGPDAAPALSALLSGWSSTAIHALAAGPMTLGDVTETIGILDEETIEDQIEEMKEASLLVPMDAEDGAGDRFVATEWLRTAIAPLAAAARQELRHPLEDTAPIAALDVQASFLLTLPMCDLPDELSGTCSLAVDLDEGVAGSPSGVTVRIEEGRQVSCEVRIEEHVEAWASASAPAWLNAVINGDTAGIRSGGDPELTRTLLNGLHHALYG